MGLKKNKGMFVLPSQFLNCVKINDYFDIYFERVTAKLSFNVEMCNI